MATLSKQFHLSHEIGARVEATNEGGRTLDQYVWAVRLVVSGPDGRYNPAHVHVAQQAVPEFLNFLELAKARMRALSAAKLQGDFWEDLSGDALDFNVSVVTDGPTPHTRLEFSTENQTFWIDLSMDDVRQWGSEFANAERIGDALVRQLEMLYSDPDSDPA